MRTLVLWLFCFFSTAFATRYAWRPDTKVFPYDVFPTPSQIDNGDNNGKYIPEIVPSQTVPESAETCIWPWVQNGACNRENNKPECAYDGGDCCRKSCLENCALRATDPDRDDCKFVCGTFQGYECIEENQGCAICSYHGVCQSQKDCLNPIFKNTRIEVIKQLLDVCHINDFSMGNFRTIDQYCGRDPYYTVIHDEVIKSLHFPGCGLLDTMCTTRPCCTDAVNNNLNSTTCNGLKQANVYDPIFKTIKPTQIDCLPFFDQCFKENYIFQGQCCQCSPGWTGMDCSTAVCDPLCVHGSCILPDVCVCEPGWLGQLCNLGKCETCEYGICVSPEGCECFYGYTGAGCNIPISVPPCAHGESVGPHQCDCEEGWTGNACDIPVCDPLCGLNGHCVRPNVCECKPQWYSSDVLAPCDSLNPMYHDPNCKEGDEIECLRCLDMFTLNPSDGLCYKCSQRYDQMCIDCNDFQCLECQWPYVVDPNTKTCFHNGILEFTNVWQKVDETDVFSVVYVRRLYGSNGTVTVDFDMTMTDPAFTRIDQKFGTLSFADQVTEQSIIFNVYRRPYYETNLDDTIFEIKLLHPFGGAEIGFRSVLKLVYFDDPKMVDALSTYATLEGYYAHETWDLLWSLKLQQSFWYPVKVFSFYDFPTLPNNLGLETYFAIERAQNRTVLQKAWQSTYIGGNEHQIQIPVFDRPLKFVHVYTSSPGYTFQYYPNTRFFGKPFIDRLENFLPKEFAMNPLKTFNFFSVNITFIASFNLPASQAVTFNMFVADNAQVSVLINEKMVLQSQNNYCTNDYLDPSYSCCSTPITWTSTLAPNNYYLFEIRYIQWEQAWNGFCIQLNRFSASLPLASIDVEAIALTELDNSPFHVCVDENLLAIDLDLSTFILVPHYNVNKQREMVEGDLMVQACITNLFQVHLRDQFGVELFGFEDLVMDMALTLSTGAVTNTSYFDEDLKVHFVEIYYCGPLEAGKKLQVFLNGNFISLGNKVVSVIPGPYSLPDSTLQTWNAVSCIAYIVCLVRLDLRDEAGNLVQELGVLDAEDSDFQLEGPLLDSFGNLYDPLDSNWLTDFYQTSVAPYEYYIPYTPAGPGLFRLYVRFGDQFANPQPLDLEIDSVLIDDGNSEFIIEGSFENDTYTGIVSVPISFYLSLRDEANSLLTSVNYDLAIKMIFDDNPSLVYTPTLVTELGTAEYQVEIVSYTRGAFQLHVAYIPFSEPGVEYQFKSSPKPIYWNSYYPNYEFSSISGSVQTSVFTGTQEYFTLAVRDEFKNALSAYMYLNETSDPPVYRVSMIADGVDVPVVFEGEDLTQGLYYFSFALLEADNNAALYVEVYSWDDATQTYSYQPIPGSPFKPTILLFASVVYCGYDDILFGGFGVTNHTYIDTYPAKVVAGEQFTVVINVMNIFNKPYYVAYDDYQDPVTLDVIPIVAGVLKECICSPRNAAYCAFFSSSAKQCRQNHQCAWEPRSTTAEYSNYGACQPCNQTEECTRYGDNPDMAVLNEYSSNQHIKVDTAVYPQGSFMFQLNLWTQGSLTYLLYRNPDFTDFASQGRYFQSPLLTFDELFDSFFNTYHEFWSIALVGKLRYAFNCQDLNQNQVVQRDIVNVTYTVTTNLKAEIYFDRELVLLKEDFSKKEISFTFTTTPHEPFDCEIYLVDWDKLPDPSNIASFFIFEEETFNLPRRAVMPNNFFQLNPGNYTLLPKIDVVPAESRGLTTNIDALSQEWSQKCEGDFFEYRAPFTLTDVRVQVRDFFGNQKLQVGQELYLNVYKGPQLKEYQPTLPIDFTLLSQVPLDTTAASENTLDYLLSVVIDDSDFSYFLVLTVNNEPLNQTCFITLNSSFVEGSQSTAQLVQQNRYLNHDDCIFAGELAYVLVEMRDYNANIVYLPDLAAYNSLFTVAFELGSDFATNDCIQYGLLSDNIVMCTIRPYLAGLSQVLQAVDRNSVSFQGFPTVVDVYPSVFKKPRQNQIQVTRTSTSLSLTLSAVDAYNNKIQDLKVPCSRFTHSRLAYFVSLHTADASKQDFIYDPFINFNVAASTIEFGVTFDPSTQPVYFNFTLLDGLLMESGVDFKFYTTDNMFFVSKEGAPQAKQEQPKPQFVGRTTETLVSSIVDEVSQLWHDMHKTYDRFSVKACTLVKPQFSETYFFSTSFAASGQLGFELWVDDVKVIGESESSGSIALKEHSWSSIKMLYRVSKPTGTDPALVVVPQFLVTWQSPSQALSTINASSGQAIALDIEAKAQMHQALIASEFISILSQ